MIVVPSANFISPDEVPGVSLNPGIDNLDLSTSFATMVAPPGWNIVLTFHVPDRDVDFGDKSVIGCLGS